MAGRWGGSPSAPGAESSSSNLDRERRAYEVKEELNYGKDGRFRRFKCHECDIQLHDQENFEKHKSGARHLKNMQRIREMSYRYNSDGSLRTGMENDEKPSHFQDRVKQFNKMRERTPSPSPPPRGWSRSSPDYHRRSRSPHYRHRSRSPGPSSRRRPPSPGSHFQIPDCIRKEQGVYKCTVCNKEAKTLDILQAHLSSKDHRKRTAPVMEYRCEPCNLVVSSEETLRQHFEGMSHMRTVKIQEQNSKKIDEYNQRRQFGGGSTSDQQELAQLRQKCQEQDKQIRNLKAGNIRLIKKVEYYEKSGSRIKSENVDSIAD